MELRKLLLEYRNETINFINAVKSQDTNAKIYIDKRAELLKRIETSENNKSELKKVFEELELRQLEEEASNCLKEEKARIQSEMIKIKNSKTASKIYGNNFNNIYFVNKKI